MGQSKKSVDYNEDELQFAAVTSFLKRLPPQLPKLPTRNAEGTDNPNQEAGYDVELSLVPPPGAKGTSIFLQFKPPLLVSRPPARLRTHGVSRRKFKLKTELANRQGRSQHEMLCDLNSKHTCRVYYVTSFIVTRLDLLQALLHNSLLDDLFCIHPSAIGPPWSNRTCNVHFGYTHDHWRAACEWLGYAIYGRDGITMLRDVRSHHFEAPTRVEAEAQAISMSLIDAIGGKRSLRPEIQELFFMETDERPIDAHDQFYLVGIGMSYTQRLRILVREVLDTEVVFMIKNERNAHP